MREQRRSVLGADEEWRDPSFALPAAPGASAPLGPNRRPSVLGPEPQWRTPAPPRSVSRRQVVAGVAAVAVLATVALGWRAADRYAPLVPGSTFGLDGELHQVEAGDDDYYRTTRFADAELPYRDGAERSWTYSLCNSGRFAVEVLDVEHSSYFLAELVGVELTHEGTTAGRRPVTLRPGQSMRVELTYRSTRCELVAPDDRAVFTGTSGLLVRQRAFGLERTGVVDLPQELTVSLAAPGSLPCPRPYSGPPAGFELPSTDVVPIAPPY